MSGATERDTLLLATMPVEVSGASKPACSIFAGGHERCIQIGIINHSKDTTAHKIGLVNINPQNPLIQLMLSVVTISKMNAAVRFKNRTT